VPRGSPHTTRDSSRGRSAAARQSWRGTTSMTPKWSTWRLWSSCRSALPREQVGAPRAELRGLAAPRVAPRRSDAAVREADTAQIDPRGPGNLALGARAGPCEHRARVPGRVPPEPNPPPSSLLPRSPVRGDRQVGAVGGRHEGGGDRRGEHQRPGPRRWAARRVPPPPRTPPPPSRPPPPPDAAPAVPPQPRR